MNKTKKELQKALVVRIAGLTILIILLMVSILYGIGVSSEINRESPVGTVSKLGTESYVTQLESLAVGKGYTTEDKVTYKERKKLETEEGRYKDVMKYLEDIDVSESEFQEIKEIESNYQKSVQQENESGKKDYSLLFTIIFTILTIIVIGLLITTSLGAY